MTDPRIAFVTTCKGRLAHLKVTLLKNLADNADYANLVFVVLDYGDRDGLWEYVKTDLAAELRSGRVVYCQYPTALPFHVAHAKNMAARCGILEGADILVTVDSDNFTGAGFAQFVAERFAENVRPGIFLCPDYQLIKSLPHGALRPVRGYAGRLALRAQTFLKVGGYDEIYDTWRGEDIDINFRLLRAGYAIRHIDNKYLHAIGHNAEVRFKEYPHAQAAYENTDQLSVIRARTETVVNHGIMGVGAVYRNYDTVPVFLKPVPTRVFGIGLHKTGTTSLHDAFRLLKLNSLHWGTGEAPMIWHEMQALGRSPTLEQFYALCDLPIPLLYKQLDKAYPGSKFVLTVRDEVDWLKSVQKLWDHRHNPTRHLWEVYPFSHQIHTVLYGRKDFDALVFLERYRRHNDEVREYFMYRPGDLLVLDMDEPRGKMAALCQFLGFPEMPDGSYPRANRSKEIGEIVT